MGRQLGTAPLAKGGSRPSPTCSFVNGADFVFYSRKSPRIQNFDYSSENIEYLVTFDKILMLNGKYYYKDMLNNGTINSRIIVVDEVK